jgi:hypothetical protein
MAIFGKARFGKSYQKTVGKDAKGLLQNNSIELVSILNKHNIISDDMSVFEMGAGPGRNLHYIWKENNSINLYANDLFEYQSMDNMHTDIKEIITFFEGDSEDIFNECKVVNVDLLLVSDHLMHLQYDKADNIITKILSDWKPKYIMLREVLAQYETPNHPRLFHKYDRFLTDYTLVHQSISINAKEYFIWLLKRN